MHNRLKQKFASELERRIEKMFEQARPLSGTMAEVPVIGGIFFPRLPYNILVRTVCAALLASEELSQDRPDWPALPLRQEDCARMLDSSDNHELLVGLYGYSLRLADYQEAHPFLDQYAAGLMAYRHTPRKLRNDPELQKEFPAAALPGLCDGWLSWRDRETIASHRYHRLRPFMIRPARLQARFSNAP